LTKRKKEKRRTRRKEIKIKKRIEKIRRKNLWK